ncbi:YjjG family noncanonical pyrimidine nucleotidase [Salinicoccus roseus]|uniref:Noncanonical pyrimidine nucleotidase, YjjG family n=1 Tax=Salinicoccus roseus TaxID=45670 RepID=A0A265E432_9STAP|nr:YjjG family noncanonical pyrimidine nucleotidase [Salinicoccus roseus]OZT76329.1 noncanonical pyrimidine nucleotidase, YjjG family [Salinicoccus roseus]
MDQYHTLLFDLDDTLLDFGKAEQTALENVMAHFDMEATPESFQLYREINKAHWEMLEQNELSKNEVLSLRHERFFEALGKKVDGSEVDLLYRKSIAEHGHHLLDGALEVVEELSRTHRLFIITNGVKETQQKRLQHSGLLSYFSGVFISEDTGYQKPMRAFFDYVATRIEHFDRKRALIIGDSLTSDIKGGYNSNIDTCWYNPLGRSNPFSFSPHYEIKQLNEIHQILTNRPF